MTTPHTRSPNRRIFLAGVLCAALVASLFAAARADGATWVIKGRGFGHGVGMSQYGAYGFALKGRNYKGILRHYYRGTRIGKTRKTQMIRVLLEIDPGDVYFRHARRACGKRLNPSRLYRAHHAGRRIVLLNARGRRLKGCGDMLRTDAAGDIRVGTHGAFRGALEVVRTESSPGSLNAINALNVNNYVQGVVPGEMPSSWPMNALRAQAVAARTYALTTKVGGNGFDLYSDTRSQVYGGLDIETARTNRAVRSTRDQVVRYRGAMAQTFYFSTSGGRTESGFLGAGDVPYLRSVRDPYDFHSPLHTWTIRYSSAEMNLRLAAYVRGRLRRIRIVKRGDSPRIDRAVLIGSRGRSRIRGDTLQFALDAYDRWMSFRVR
jgi:stage II sporulation protein D